MAFKLPPQPIGVAPGHSLWNDWYEKLRYQFNSGSVSVTWTNIDFTGSSITDIVTRPHNQLQSIQGGAANDYYHLTGTQHTDLTDGGDSTLHFHSSDRARANHTGTQDHNTTLSGLQGGTAGEYYHTTAAQNTTIASLTSGTYTPTLTGVANVTATTAYPAHYMRIGSIVTVTGYIEIDPTASGVATQVGISLPIASAFTVNTQLSGVGTSSGSSLDGMSGTFLADTTNDRAELLFAPTNNPNSAWTFSFMYEVI